MAAFAVRAIDVRIKETRVKVVAAWCATEAALADARERYAPMAAAVVEDRRGSTVSADAPAASPLPLQRGGPMLLPRTSALVEGRADSRGEDPENERSETVSSPTPRSDTTEAE
jgi:hypothetical protein